MRTTVEIDDAVLIAVTERARREGRSVGAVVTELLRSGLTTDTSFFGFDPLPSRGTVVSNEVVECLRDEDGV